jgi:probable rRNA maturation factor
MLDVEVLGVALATDGPSISEVRRLCRKAAASVGIRDGHVAVEFVDGERITQLNAAHRALAEPTDVLSFPIDGVEALAPGGPLRDPAAGLVMRELGDVVICPAQTSDLREAIVHGMLHLLGMDHESDDGEMLRLQRRLLDGEER